MILNRTIRLIDGTLTGITIPNQSGPGSNDNEGVLYTTQSFKTEAPPPHAFGVIPMKKWGRN